jgi:hypothetical protein
MPMTRRKVIQPHYFLVQSEQRLQQITADEACDTGNQPTVLMILQMLPGFLIICHLCCVFLKDARG